MRPLCSQCSKPMHRNCTIRGKQQWRCRTCGVTVLEGATGKAGRKPIDDGLSKWQRYRRKKKERQQ